MKKLSIIFILLAVLILPGFSLAQNRADEIHELEEVVVTATHKMKMLDTPASISIITAKELEEMGAKNIAEALKKIPGVIDKSASKDALAIRGAQSSMAGGPVILIDGVPQKIGDNRYDYFDFIPVSQVERIEVLRSAGISYGPGSARGVINIITKKGKKDIFSGEAKTSYGSWDTTDSYASVSGAINKWDYLINAGHFNTDGYEDEDTRKTSALLKVGYNLNDNARLGIKGSLIKNCLESTYDLKKYKWQLENFRREKHFPKSETDSTLYWHTEKDQDINALALDFSHNDESMFINSAASWTYYNEDYKDLHEKFTSPKKVHYDDKDQDTHTFTLSGGYNFDLGKLGYTPSLGFNFEVINFDQETLYPNDPDKNTDKYDFDVDERQYGFFWDNDFLFGKSWGLKIGGRVDKAELKFEDKVPTKVDQDETMYGWSVAPSYYFGGRANVYASAGRNFWFPTPRYYAWAAEKGGDLNRPEDLKPEESHTYELGYKHLVHKAFNVALTGFFTDYQDKFASYYDTAGTWRGMKNIGEAEIKGLELEADGRISPLFGYRLVGTYLKAEWTKGQVRVYEHPSNNKVMRDLDGYEIYGIPNYTYVIGLDFYPAEGLKCSLDINGTGPYYVDYLNRIDYGAKTTVDANVSYKIKNWKFWVLGKNIFDEEIERVINSTGRLTQANGEYKNAYYVLDGIYIAAGVSYSFSMF
ncbi:MAG: TonB-dependent receptor [Deltaproteobacteria bacterium]|nr:TonB-dependent receptor [Deltaproteobacteria bacterium]